MQNLEIVLTWIHEKTNGGKEFWDNHGLLFFRDNGSTNYEKTVSVTRCNNDGKADIRNPLSLLAHERSRFVHLKRGIAYSAFKL